MKTVNETDNDGDNDDMAVANFYRKQEKPAKTKKKR